MRCRLCLDFELDLDLDLEDLDLEGAVGDHAVDEWSDEEVGEGETGGELSGTDTASDCCISIEHGTSLFLSEAPCSIVVTAVVWLMLEVWDLVFGGMIDGWGC